MSLINPTPEQQAALREFGRASAEWSADSLGTVTVCAECDSPQDVVRDYLAGGSKP